jgi:hypothetical protein
VLSSTISSYRVLWLCHQYLTPKYRQLVSAARQHKRVHHLRSRAEIDALLNRVSLEAKHAWRGPNSALVTDACVAALLRRDSFGAAQRGR